MVQNITYGLKGIQLYLIWTVFPLAYNVRGKVTFILTNNLILYYLYLVQLNFVQLVFVVCLTEFINHQSHNFLFLISHPVFIMPGPFDSIISFCEIVNYVAIVCRFYMDSFLSLVHMNLHPQPIILYLCIIQDWKSTKLHTFLHKSVKIWKSTNIHII